MKAIYLKFLCVIIFSTSLCCNGQQQDAHEYEFGTYAPIYDSYDLSTTNHWHPNFHEIPIREQSRIMREDVQWGIKTNYIKAGLVLQYSSDTNRPDIAFYPVLHSDYTNSPNSSHEFYPDKNGAQISLWLPPIHQRYQMTLWDDKGNLVPKTKWGEGFGQPMVQSFRRIRIEYQDYHLFNLSSIIPSPILLRDCFNTIKAGKYHLEFEIRAMRETATKPPYEECHCLINVDFQIK
jgi:hypothetical protein